MKLLSKGYRVFDRVLSFLSWLTGAMLIFIMLNIVVEVVLRYSANKSLRWVVDVNLMLQVWMPFLTAAWVLRDEGHVTLDTLIVALRPRVRALLKAITSFVLAIFCLYYGWYGLLNTIEFYQLGLFIQRVLTIPTFLIVFPIPLGLFLLAIEFFRRSYRSIKEYQGPEA